MPAEGAKVAVVTGASSGIGLHAAEGLARAGMRVVMAGRDASRIEAARRFVTTQAPGAEVETLLADFSVLAEVRRLAAEILERCDRLGPVVNYCKAARNASPGFRDNQ
jgi:NAD(P)-dependent dehydrogenase (short-subunit alcohol dehydrogenase family)